MRHLLPILLLLPFIAAAQTVDSAAAKQPLIAKVLKGDPLSLQGNIGANFRSYSAWGIDSRQTPFSSTISANATIQSFQFSIPFSFLLNNLSSPSATTPFAGGYFKDFFKNQKDRLSRFGASPHRGWFRAHLGDRYMSFSEYTMNNHNFRGAGVELTPGKFRFSAMGGRLAKAEPRNLAINQPNFLEYERLGWGAKAGYGDAQNFVEAIVFKASDIVEKPNPVALDSNSAEMPAQNLVLGLNGRKQIGKKLSVDFEFAQSALTRNNTDPVYAPGAVFPLYNSFLFKTRSSTEFRSALKAGINWAGEAFQAGLNYSRVDPGYKTLGAYFFNDDLEDIRGNISLPLLKNNLNLSGSLGIQRNNLDGTKPSDFLRIIGNLNLDYRKDKWGLGGRFNNYDSRVDYTLDPNNPDSLKAIVVNRDLSFYSSYSLSGEDGRSRQINLHTGFQGVTDNLSNPDESRNSRMFFANLSMTARTASKWQYTFGLDLNQNWLPFDRNAAALKLNSRWGANAAIMKSLLKDKCNLSLGSNFFYAFQPLGEQSNYIFNHYFRNNWRIGNKHSLNFQLNLMQSRPQGTGSEMAFSELIGSLGYNTQFGWTPSSKR
jgi:hypothetical protein